MEELFNPSVMSSAIRVATPLLLAAFGCLLCQRAGIINFAIEGFMLMGAFLGIAVTFYCNGNVWLGMLGAMVGTTLFSGLFGLAVIKFKANQIVSSIAINMLSLGLTSFLMRSMFDVQGLYRPSNLVKIPNINFDFLDRIPVVHVILNNQSIIVYVAILLTFVVYYTLKKTVYGLNVTSIGESEDASRAAGVSTKKIQWSVILISGLLCGLAGAYLSTTILSAFSENMIQGRGFTAFTAVVFGNANPIWVALVTLLFGYADAIGIQIALLGINIPQSIVKMLPYVLALIVLTISSATTIMRKNKGVVKRQ